MEASASVVLEMDAEVRRGSMGDRAVPVVKPLLVVLQVVATDVARVAATAVEAHRRVVVAHAETNRGERAEDVAEVAQPRRWWLLARNPRPTSPPP